MPSADRACVILGFFMPHKAVIVLFSFFKKVCGSMAFSDFSSNEKYCGRALY